MALEFGRDADGYGVLSSVLAIGSLTGALLAARRDRARVRVLVMAAGGFGVASVISALMPTYWAYGATLMLVGFTIVTMLTTANGYVQTTTDAALRGRVLALYMAVIMGSTPIGAPIAGWIVDTFSARTAIMVGGIAGILAFSIGIGWMLWSGRLHRTGERRFQLTLDETRPLSVIRAMDPGSFDDRPTATTPIRLAEPRDGED
jgi:MFS family permease